MDSSAHATQSLRAGAGDPVVGGGLGQLTGAGLHHQIANVMAGAQPELPRAPRPGLARVALRDGVPADHRLVDCVLGVQLRGQLGLVRVKEQGPEPREPLQREVVLGRQRPARAWR